MGTCCTTTKHKSGNSKALSSYHAHAGSMEKSNTQDSRTSKAFTPGQFVRSLDGNIEDYFKILKCLGDGASGEVFLALHKESGQRCAIKSILLHSNSKKTAIIDEIEIMKTLDHPNIVRIYDSYRSPTAIHISMEYCAGGELFDRVSKKNTLTENTVAKYFFDLISALQYLHRQSIVHRDLKPENLLLEHDASDARVKLTDFGSATRLNQYQRLDAGIGTSYYMAPEVIIGDYDSRCDIWSAGVILYILLSGKPPFNGENDAVICQKILTTEVSFKRSVWNSVSEEAKVLITQMLNKQAKLRPTLAEVLANPWLTLRSQNKFPDNTLTSATLQNLAGFQSQNHLLNAALAFVAARMLSQDQVAQLGELFNEIDENHDGELSVDEIRRAVNTLGQSNLPAEKIIVAADLNGDGVIEYNEFLTAAVNWSKNLSNEALYQAFKQYDANGDGKLSLEEIKEAVGAPGELLVNILEEADANGDGEIDFEEFSSYIYKKLTVY